VAKYRYDGLSRRIERQADSAAPGSPDGTLDVFEHFFYAGSQVVETRNATATGAQPEALQAKYQYVWSARYGDAPVLRDANTDTDGLCDDVRNYFLTDANMNVTAITDSAGAVQERYVYEAYGKPTIYNADWSATRTTSSYDNNLLFTGREFDPATGLSYYRSRWLDHGTGGMTARDPLGFAAGDANLYRYVENNPLSLTDPSGMDGSGGQSGGGVKKDGEDAANETMFCADSAPVSDSSLRLTDAEYLRGPGIRQSGLAFVAKYKLSDELAKTYSHQPVAFSLTAKDDKGQDLKGFKATGTAVDLSKHATASFTDAINAQSYSRFDSAAKSAMESPKVRRIEVTFSGTWSFYRNTVKILTSTSPSKPIDYDPAKHKQGQVIGTLRVGGDDMSGAPLSSIRQVIPGEQAPLCQFSWQSSLTLRREKATDAWSGEARISFSIPGNPELEKKMNRRYNIVTIDKALKKQLVPNR
jgi:RHS repeat-associated protein